MTCLSLNRIRARRKAGPNRNINKCDVIFVIGALQFVSSPESFYTRTGRRRGRTMAVEKAFCIYPKINALCFESADGFHLKAI